MRGLLFTLRVRLIGGLLCGALIVGGALLGAFPALGQSTFASFSIAGPSGFRADVDATHHLLVAPSSQGGSQTLGVAFPNIALTGPSGNTADVDPSGHLLIACTGCGGGGGAQVYPVHQNCSATAVALTATAWTTVCSVTFPTLPTSAGPAAKWVLTVFASGTTSTPATSDSLCITGPAGASAAPTTASQSYAISACPTGQATATSPLAGAARGATTGGGAALQATYVAEYANGATPTLTVQLLSAGTSVSGQASLSAVAEPI